jgi:site-specific DNA recombinase
MRTPYLPEDQLSAKLGDVLKDIYGPDHIVRTIVESVGSDQDRCEAERKQHLLGIQQRLSTLRTRMDRMYEDKLDGRVDEEFWSRKMAEWREQEHALQSPAEALKAAVSQDHVLTAQRTLELANKAHFLYLGRNHAERGQLLKLVLSNCVTDGVSITPTYKSPST